MEIRKGVRSGKPPLVEAHGKIEDAFHACLAESVLSSFEPEEK